MKKTVDKITAKAILFFALAFDKTTPAALRIVLKDQIQDALNVRTPERKKSTKTF